MTAADIPEGFTAPYTTANLNTAQANAAQALNSDGDLGNVFSARHRDCGGACVTISVPTGVTSEIPLVTVSVCDSINGRVSLFHSLIVNVSAFAKVPAPG